MEEELTKRSKSQQKDLKKALYKKGKYEAKHPGTRIMDEAVYCPCCGAMAHPYKIDEGDALYCGACNQNMTPTVNAMKQYMKDYVALVRGEDVEKIDDSAI